MSLTDSIRNTFAPRSAPPLRLLASEPLRALREYIAHHRRGPDDLPRGDGHPVIIFPGLATDGLAVRPLRRRLRQLGHDAIDWGRGLNAGPGRDLDAWLHELARHVQALAARRQRSGRARHDGRISLVGWSLGGLYAREVAKQMGAQRVRRVVTIGTPFNATPDATHAALVYRLLNGAVAPAGEALRARLRRAPPVPTTSIYSRRDGIVDWRACLHGGPQRADVEDVELDSSHLGMGWNPEVVAIVARRLARR